MDARLAIALAASLIALAAPACSSSNGPEVITTQGAGSASSASSGGVSTSGSSSSGSMASSSSSGGGGSSSGSNGSSGSSSGGSSGSGSTGSSSGTSTSGDGGPSDTGAWLQPMNVARAAVGEAALTWDPIAAQVAQDWANQCDFNHNPNASSDYDALGGTGGLGENLAAGAPTESVADAVASWVAEEQYYDHATNTCATGQVCGHYTQVVWSTTTAAGCAQAICTTGSPFGSGQWQVSVCDFSPPGNYVGQAPY